MCRIFTGPADIGSLGGDPDNINIGHCNSCYGRLELSVAYRKAIDAFQRWVKGLYIRTSGCHLEKLSRRSKIHILKDVGEHMHVVVVSPGIAGEGGMPPPAFLPPK